MAMGYGRHICQMLCGSRRKTCATFELNARKGHTNRQWDTHTLALVVSDLNVPIELSYRLNMVVS